MGQDTRAHDDHHDNDARNGDAGGGQDVPDEDKAIGANARRIRQRRGLALEVVAGLAKISTGQLSKLETGKRAWIKRGLIENVADALSCSPRDLAGQESEAPDQQSAIVRSAIPELTVAIHDTTLEDAPDLPARPVHKLAEEARQANIAADHVDHVRVGRRLANLLTELHVQASQGNTDTRRAALEALVEACMAGNALARTMGAADLSLTIARRGYDAARLLERDDLIALMATNRGHALMRIGARRRASAVFAEGLAEVEALPGPTTKDTRLAEARGMLHLYAALLSARDSRPSDAATHLEEARSLAAYTGERNHMLFHFGPANVAAWDLAIGVETEQGPAAAERFLASGADVSVLESKGRECYIQFDLARALAQAEGTRDLDAVLALDRADRVAPLQIRNDPLAQDLARQFRRRARVRLWELDSLCNRLGVA